MYLTKRIGLNDFSIADKDIIWNKVKVVAMTSYIRSLNALHDSLAEEVNKLVRWEVDTVVHRKDVMTQLNQSRDNLSDQEMTITDLQEKAKIIKDCSRTDANKR